MTLKLTNNLTKASMTFDVEDKNVSGLYYVVDIQLQSRVDEGEYTYQLYDKEKMVAHGLLQVGDYKPENTTYNNGKQDYIVYGG